MNSRMDKYKEEVTNKDIPTRSDKYKQLYRQVYDAYDGFENLIVPSNAKEITPMELKEEITSRSEYQMMQEYKDIIRPSATPSNNKVARKEMIQEQQRQENEIYDIKELLNKAVGTKKDDEEIIPTLTNEDYLKRLKLDDNRTNIEQVKEMYDEIRKETMDEEENDNLLKTANLSLEILSDLKSDNEKTTVSPPIKEDEWIIDKGNKDSDFYSSTYKFSKKDFEDKKADNISEQYDEEDNNDDFQEDKGNRKFFFKILMLIFGISLVAIIVIYLFNYFNRV